MKLMKKTFVSILFFLICVSCNDNKHENQSNYILSNDEKLKILEYYCIKYKPSSIDFDESVKNDKILYFLVTNINIDYSDKLNIKKLYRCIIILFLKQCIYANHDTPLPVNLFPYNDLKLKKLFLIYYYIHDNIINETPGLFVQGFSTSQVYFEVKQDKFLMKDKTISNLIDSVDKIW